MLAVKGEPLEKPKKKRPSKRKGKEITPLFLLDVWANKWYSSIFGSGPKCALGAIFENQESPLANSR
jgi:hypothetical protein